MKPEEFPSDEAFTARKKPVEVDVYGPVEERVEIDTREGTVVAEAGEYVIRGVQGEIYPIAADIFDETYQNGASRSVSEQYDIAHPAGARWRQKAVRNVTKWGQQDLDTLTLAAMEELGELTQAILEHRAEDGDPERIQDELDDLAALMYQLQWAVAGLEGDVE